MEESTTAGFDYDAWTPQPQDPSIDDKHWVRTRVRWMYVSVYFLTLFLGTPLNLTVVVKAIWRAVRKKPHPPCRAQIVGLAITNLALCLVTPLYLGQAWHDFSWPFGKALCKFGSYVRYMNMFSCGLIVALWNVRLCVPRRCLPPHHVSSSLVLLAWFLAAILAAPSWLSRDLRKTAATEICRDNYDYDTEAESLSPEARERMRTVVFVRLVFGLLLPLVVVGIISCGRKHRRPGESTGHRLVASAYFLCWGPVLVLSTFQIVKSFDDNLYKYGLPCSIALCSLYSVVCPIICLTPRKEEQDVSSENEHATSDSLLMNELGKN